MGTFHVGARSLEGLSLVVDARKKKLVAAGPLPAATAGLRVKLAARCDCA